MKMALKLLLLGIILFPLAFFVPLRTSLKHSFDWMASAYTIGDPEYECPPGLSTCFHTADQSPCGGNQTSCDGVIGNQQGEYQLGADGEWYFGPETFEGDDDGGVDGPDPVTTPSIPPPPGSGRGIIQVYAIAAPVEYFTTCNQLELIKTCLDSPSADPQCPNFSDASYLAQTTIYMNGGYDDIQTDATGVTYSNVPAQYVYYVTASHPSNNYSTFLACHSSSHVTPIAQGNGEYLYPDDTITFLVGMPTILPWYQVHGGGNVFGDTIYSLMPLSVSPTLQFDLTAVPATPGVISSKTDTDFADSIGYYGRHNISSTNWNTNSATTPKDWYPFFTHRLAQATQTPYPGTGGKPPVMAGQSYSVYTTAPNVIKDLTINTPWSIGDGEKLIMIVDGTLDIRNTITITGSGFVAFVVKNDILINSAVGTTWNSTTPVVEGMYIAGGTIKTGVSTAIATERFVGKGMFAANAILTQRNLITAGRNRDTSADLFLYNPAFLVTMPDILKDISYHWQEVAP